MFCYREDGPFEKYRIGNKWPDTTLTWACIRHNLLDHLFLNPLTTYFIWPLFSMYGMTAKSPFPGYAIMFRDFVVAVLFNDFLFYWGHRMLHDNQFLYQHIHKKHHEFKNSIGIASGKSFQIIIRILILITLILILI
jgi:sterol desaturase/sphingolipid hydroxylase (fatty acid hydroxylase superfamily)